MNSGYGGPTNELDRIRWTKGMDGCKYYFGKLGKERRPNAVRLVNDSRLHFASLFTLQPEIRELNLKDELSERSRIALHLCEQIRNGKKVNGNSNAALPFPGEAVHTALMWMLQSGAADDGMSSEFDQVLDISASVLIKTHHEKTVLPLVTDLIFKRNRRGSYHHDLIWAVFQAQDVYTLRLIAGYLRSSVQADVDLACTLLHLPKEEKPRTNTEKQRKYAAYLSWLKENSPYLYFTGESFQYSNSPAPCGLNLEAKYLSKKISPRSRKPVEALTETEQANLSGFQGVQEEEKSVLAKYSRTLHEENPSRWNQWMQYPVEKQLQIAKSGRRGSI